MAESIPHLEGFTPREPDEEWTHFRLSRLEDPSIPLPGFLIQNHFQDSTDKFLLLNPDTMKWHTYLSTTESTSLKLADSIFAHYHKSESKLVKIFNHPQMTEALQRHMVCDDAMLKVIKRVFRCHDVLGYLKTWPTKHLLTLLKMDPTIAADQLNCERDHWSGIVYNASGKQFFLKVIRGGEGLDSLDPLQKTLARWKEPNTIIDIATHDSRGQHLVAALLPYTGDENLGQVPYSYKISWLKSKQLQWHWHFVNNCI